MQLADFLDPALQSQLQSTWDDALQFLSSLEWPTLEDAQIWSELHPDAVLLGGLFLGLICLVGGVGWWVSRMPVAPQPDLAAPQPGPEFQSDEQLQPDEEPRPSGLPDFEMRLGISREDLAEVGLPMLTPEPPASTPAPAQRMTSLEELSIEHLMVVARYCVWKGDTEGAQEAVAPIMARGDALQRYTALVLLEGC